MQTLHLSRQNHLSAGLEHSKQRNKKDQEKEDETEISIYTSLIRQDEFSNLEACFLKANWEKEQEGENVSGMCHNLQWTTSRKNYLQPQKAFASLIGVLYSSLLLYFFF